MKSQLDVLEQDLRALQIEFKKKNTQIKDSCDLALKWISDKKDKNYINCQPKELLEPLQLIFQSKSVKSYPQAVNCLQKIAQMFTISEELLTLSVVEMLREATTEFIDEMSQIRVLQLLLTFLDPKTTVLSKDFVNSILLCCFQLFDTKSNSVKSTIQATLSTLTTLITDKFNNECKKCGIVLNQNNEKKELTQQDLELIHTMEQQIIYGVLYDMLQKIAFTLILFEQAQNPSSKKQVVQKASVWNLKPSQNAKCVMLDLSNLIIFQTKGNLCHFQGIINLFEQQLVPILCAMLANNKNVNSLIGLRQMKCSILIIQHLQVGINMLQYIIAESETLGVKSKDGTILLVPSWRNLIGFECLQIAIGNPELTRIFSQSFFPNSSNTILIQVLEAYLRAAKAIESNQLLSQDQNQQQQQYIGTQRIAKLIDSQLIDTELTVPSTQQIERIIIESVCSFSDNFVHVFQAIGVKLGTYAGSSNRNQNFQSEEDNDSETQCKQLLQMSWRPLLDSIQRLIKSNIDEASCQMLLKSYQSCIGACGSANCFEARDAFLSSLCQQCVQIPFPQIMTSSNQKVKVQPFEFKITERNILMSKTLLNIAHCLCHILDVKSWFLILETMQNIEITIQRRGTTSETPYKQPILNFNDLRSQVQQKMQDFNIIERSQNKGTAHHTRISSVMKSNSNKSISSMPVNSLLQVQMDERSLDIQILQDSLNSLFTSSLLFDEQSLAELICALAQLTVTKMQDGNQSSSQEIQDFGLRKLIETALVNVSRIDIFWKIIIAHFDILSQSKDSVVRQYIIEAMQLLVIEIFSFKKLQSISSVQNQEDVIDPDEPSDFDVSQEVKDSSQPRIQDEQWQNDTWQYTILSPFQSQLKTNHSQDKILVLKCLEKIIQVCGQQVRNDGWRIIILSISKSVETENEQVTSCGFRCLKLIVSNYISKLTLPNFKTVLNAIHLYAQNRGENINSNLIAISMFQNVADFIARQIKSEIYTFKNTWLVVFERIKDLALDHRAEVRRTNIHTLDNIIMTHGSTFITNETEEDEIWPFLLDKVILTMLKEAIVRFEQNQTISQQHETNNLFGQPCQTPQFSSQKKINFEEASVVKALKKHDEQWEDTCSILAETACKAFKKYFTQSLNPERGAEFWENLVGLLVRLLEISENSMELCKIIFKSLSDLAPICSAVISQDSINQLLRIAKHLVSSEIEKSQDDRNQVLRLLKSVPVLVESLRKIFEQTELFDRNTESLYQLLTQLTQCSGSSDGYLGFGQPNKLLSEEKVVFDFVEVLCSPTIAYFDFLFQFLKFDKNENRSEAFIRRAMSIFFNAILRGKFCTPQQQTNLDSIPTIGLFSKVLPQLFNTLADLVELRYDVEAAKICIFQAKGQPTLFYTCGLYLILISSFLINPDQFKARIQAYQLQNAGSRLGAPKRSQTVNISSTSSLIDLAIGETGGVQVLEDQSVLQKYPLLSTGGPEFSEDMLFTGLDIALVKTEEMHVDIYNTQITKDMVWELTQQKLISVLQFEPSRLKQSQVSSEVLKSSQDLDIQTINFIVNCLLPNSVDHSNTADFEQQLVQIIDQGCQQLSNSNTSDSLSKYCLNNLFELSKQQVWPTNSHHYEIRKKVAHITTPILVNRCRICLQKYIQDEQKSGLVKLPQQRISEVTFILKKLLELESNDKDHLIQLMPVFSSMVLSGELQLREILSKILLEISGQLTKIYPQKTRCSSGGD